MKNAIFWDVTPCSSRKIRHFGGTYRLHHQGDNNRRARNNVSSNYQPNHAAKKYRVRSEASVLSRATRRHITEDGILHKAKYSLYR
jgi:hypothetical protein